MSDRYTTPEGFDLYRPLLMPDARSFADVLTYERPWDFATMNYRNGYPQADTPEEIMSPGGLMVSRFCSVRNQPGGHLMVTPTPATLALVDSGHFAFFDRVGFEAIYHESNKRVLIVASASGIIASRWVAYVDPATVPNTKVAPRDPAR